MLLARACAAPLLYLWPRLQTLPPEKKVRPCAAPAICPAKNTNDSLPAMVLQAIKYQRGSLQILDQLRLPHEEVYDEVHSAQDAWHAIKEMRTRGAPAIAIVAALGLAVELETIAAKNELSSVAEEVKVFVEEKLSYLVTSRPTAVNLADAARKLNKTVDAAASAQDASGLSVKDAYVKAAEKMLVDDVSDNENIGKHGAEWIVKNTEAGKGGQVSVVTHCNTGYGAIAACS